MASIPILDSIDIIRKQYPTGEEPVLVMCSDMNRYICKYIIHSPASAQKLTCELIGVKMAETWGLFVPKAVLVKVKPEHWPTSTDSILSSPLFRYLVQNVSKKRMQELHGDFNVSLSRCRLQVNSIIEDLPSDWGITAETVSHKLKQLFELDWVEAVWNNFEECLNENI
ncbi:MAG: hypothetical protein K5986_01635 [Clostridium sp.]|nr:hypothetical protein [Clostridium sp.]